MFDAGTRVVVSPDEDRLRPPAVLHIDRIEKTKTVGHGHSGRLIGGLSGVASGEADRAVTSQTWQTEEDQKCNDTDSKECQHGADQPANHIGDHESRPNWPTR